MRRHGPARSGPAQSTSTRRTAIADGGADQPATLSAAVLATQQIRETMPTPRAHAAHVSRIEVVEMEAEQKRRLAAMALALCVDEEDYYPAPKRSCWVKDWMCRKELGLQNQLFKELVVSDPSEYRRLLRLSREQFAELLARMGPRIARKTTVMRQPIQTAAKLQATLRYLASGESHHSLSRQFRVGHSTANDFIPETCSAIYHKLSKDYIKSPKTVEDWRYIIRGFDENWQFPNCGGAIDGKHVCITKPANSGSLYFNYKKSFSIMLLAVVDANYKFTYIDVGVPGARGDAGVWQTTPLQEALEGNRANLPDHVEVGPGLFLPPVFLADDAFPIGKNLMKPYGGSSLSGDQRIFNYRLSRARRVVENAFGILANRFRFLLTTINAGPERVEGSMVREDMRDYFNGQGVVPWQRASAYVDE
nr:uncharacterized protein LOC129387071 [Dermacentor andersoni]